MPKSFKINSSINSYDVLIGIETINFIKSIKRNFVIIIDEKLSLENYHFKNCIKIKAQEDSKDLSNISIIISKIRDLSLKKDDVIIGIGGGVIQDITCFIASIYMRGVDWIYIPTTLLGMCDSCIGGKSSINVNGIKNLVGNFYPPKNILIDLSFLDSLNQEQITSGLCEAIKIYYTFNQDERFENFAKLFDDKNLDYYNLVHSSLETKKWFIENDEFDKNERRLLNFGHTFGHAIESASNYMIPHGIAVGFGMLWAIYFSEIENNRSKILNNLIDNILKKHKNFCKIIIDILPEEVLKSFTFDKKHKLNHYICILLDKNGFLYQASLPKNDEFINKFQSSFKKLKEQLI